MSRDETFDFIIVGAGAAGCVLARRLSEAPDTSVLLLEAGPDDTADDIHDPGGFVRLWGSDLDWAFQTPEQKPMQGRQIVINQGRVLGGSTAINAMMYVRGNPRDFDRWNERTGGGWSYEDVLPYFKKLEDYAGGASDYRGTGGPLKVQDNPDPHSRSDVFRDAATSLGYDGPDWDYNAGRQAGGAGVLQFTIAPDGTRSSAATAFLDPVADRPNLTVRTGAMVTRVLLDGTRATGVEYGKGGDTAQVYADREVLISTGTLVSPKLLMLSGMGPAAHLQEHGIEVRADLPGVGQNLQDHLQLPVVYRAKRELPQPEILSGNVLFLKTRTDEAAVTPDLQLNFTPAVPLPLASQLDFGVPAGIFLPIMVQPRSTGAVTLQSNDPLDAPRVDPNYLQADADVQTFREALGIIREMAATDVFEEAYDGELVPGPDGDDEAHIRTMTSTIWHPAGTCQMGTSEAAVVDPELRVRGVDRLRVIDASVMPVVTSGNTLAAVYMIAEKAAAMIRNEHS